MKISHRLAALVSSCSTILFTAALAQGSSGSFDWENLQSDIPGVAEQTDRNVANPWGIAVSSSGLVWVADNGTGNATVYYEDGTAAPNSGSPLVVNTASSSPTGLVSNNTSFFKVTNGSNTLPAKIIFVGEDGIISGWNAQLSSSNAFVARNNGASAVYKGATLGTAGSHNFLYVTNFRSGQVETYNENFVLRPASSFPFVDPSLPGNYRPFGIRNFGGKIVVTFVPFNPSNPDDDLAGAGNGIIDIFNTNGQFLKRLVSNGKLNAPWGLEVVSDALWVGNFGDGQINVYNSTSGAFLGRPRDVFGTPLRFQGLWGLWLSNGSLYFTAGIVDEEHGIFGAIFND